MQATTTSLRPRRDRDAARVLARVEHGSISIELESGPRGSQLTIWDSGETELDRVDTDAGVHIPQHRIIATADDADKLLSHN